MRFLVFLRHLEYFQGIIILTSNRVEGFDPAVISRIHLSLPFYPQGAETRQRLWEQMLGRLTTKDVGYQLRDVLPIVIDMPMNGREISNAVNTIRALAREENRKINETDFRTFKNLTPKDGGTENANWTCSIQ
jgi:hypothetical protein